MKKLISAAVIAGALLVGTAGGAWAERPTPAFSLGCYQGGEAVVTWANLSVQFVFFTWNNNSPQSGGSTYSHKPTGTFRIAVPAGATSVTAVFIPWKGENVYYGPFNCV